MIRNAWRHFGGVIYNILVTRIPSHAIRCAFLRLWGAKVGRGVAIGRGTTVLGIDTLVIGSSVRVGNRCLLDGRGHLTIGDRVVISNDVHFIAGHHDPNTPDFAPVLMPIVVEDAVWIASRSMVLAGVVIGRGAVIGACSLVRRDVAARDIVAGIPARSIGSRTSDLDYSISARKVLA